MIRSTFATLNLANRALTSQQIGLDITGHNIANANTDGFTRQAAEMLASTPFTINGTTRPQQPGQLGTGVDVSNIKRFRDGFLDLQYRAEQQIVGQWESTRDAIDRLQQLVNEPSRESLAASLSKFWNDWSALANAPESRTARKGLLEDAVTLTTQINQMQNSLQRQQEQLDRQVQLRVDDINNLTTRIARLNDQVIRIVGAGDQPNDLRDQRDQLLDQLSKIVNISYTETSSGAVSVSIGGRTAVTNNQSFRLATHVLPSEGFADQTRLGVFWAVPPTSFTNSADVRSGPDVADLQNPVNVTGGQLRGDLNARDVIIQTQAIDQLNRVAKTIIDQVNDVHRAGYGLNNSTGQDFFIGTTAADMAVNPAVASNLDAIAAAGAPDAPGDGSNALAIHDLQRMAFNIDPGTVTQTTIEDFYAGVIANIGILGQQAKGMAENEALLSGHLAQQRQSLGGVSLDEETTNLIRYQHAYNAAARVVTVVDEMLDRIINNMGIVGR